MTYDGGHFSNRHTWNRDFVSPGAVKLVSRVFDKEGAAERPAAEGGGRAKKQKRKSAGGDPPADPSAVGANPLVVPAVPLACTSIGEYAQSAGGEAALPAPVEAHRLFHQAYHHNPHAVITSLSRIIAETGMVRGSGH